MKRLLAGVLAGLLLCVCALTAQDDKDKKDTEHTRSVKGRVLLPSGGGARQAVVYLKNTKTLQIHSFITKDDGSYYFHELSPDVDYELMAKLSGGFASKTRTLSSFDSRKDPEYDLKLEEKK